MRMALLRVTSDGLVGGRLDLRALTDVELRQLIRPLAQIEREAIESAMILCEGNRKLAAKYLKVSRQTISARVQQYRLADGL